MMVFSQLVSVLRVTTTLVRPGRAPLGKDSKVRRPITMVCPNVMALNRFKSLGKWHKRSCCLPIALFEAMATISEIIYIG